MSSFLAQNSKTLLNIFFVVRGFFIIDFILLIGVFFNRHKYLNLFIVVFAVNIIEALVFMFLYSSLGAIIGIIVIPVLLIILGILFGKNKVGIYMLPVGIYLFLLFFIRFIELLVVG